MDNKVFIIHCSAIVQNGLAHILRRNFKCVIKCFYDFTSFIESDENITSGTMIFAEEKIANSEKYIQFLNETNDLKSYSIDNCGANKTQNKSHYTLHLYDSPDEIYEQIKHDFKRQELIDEVSEELSNREIDVLKLVALGYSNKEIADKLFISTHTVMSHRKNITEKLGIKSISGLTVYAIINNYINTTNINLEDLI